MAKTITEVYEVPKEGRYNGRLIKVVGSNKDKHDVEVSGADSIARMSLSTSEMKELAMFLIETATKIDSDPDFIRK